MSERVTVLPSAARHIAQNDSAKESQHFINSSHVKKHEEWTVEVWSKINLHKKIPEDHSGGKENTVTLYKILVRQDWVEQEKMREKDNSVICFTDV